MPVTITAVDEVWTKWINERDNEAANCLIQTYMPLVSYHVQRIGVGLPKTIRKDELMSHGVMGLYDALEKFDMDRDLKFDTYASFRIRGAIIDGLRKEDWLPRSMREKIKKVEQAIERIEQTEMRHVTIEEVAEHLDMPHEEVAEIVSESFYANVLSLENELDQENDGNYFRDVIEDKNMDRPDTLLMKEEMNHELAQVICKLNKNEQLVISFFYYEELTLTEIGQVLGLSTSRISQIHSKALFKLKQAMKF